MRTINDILSSLASAPLKTERLTIEFRSATARDETFVDLLSIATMIEYVQRSWSDPEKVAHYFDINSFATRTTSTLILEASQDGHVTLPAGAVTLKSHKLQNGHPAIDLSQIHIAHKFQGQGLGTAIIAHLQTAVAPLPLTLMVLKTNPATRLYERMGFHHVGDGEGPTEKRAFFEWYPAGYQSPE